MYEQKMTVLEKEFTQYQKLAIKVMSALDVIDNMTQKLTGQEEKNGAASDDENAPKAAAEPAPNQEQQK